jgi:hypothetical protein
MLLGIFPCLLYQVEKEKEEIMKSSVKTVFLIALLGIALVISWNAANAQRNEAPPAPQSEMQDGNTRTLDSVQPQGLIGFITTSNPYCYQPDVTRNECVINFRYTQANQDGNSPYLKNLQFSIDGKIRYYSGMFFENSNTYDYAMVPQGFKVLCGSPNESGLGNDYGKSYSVVISAISNTGTQMGANYFSVACPAYAP